MAIFSQLLDISVDDAWLLYRREYVLTDDKYLRLKDFRLKVAQGQKEPPLGMDLHNVPGPSSRNIIINLIMVRPAEETRDDGHSKTCTYPDVWKVTRVVLVPKDNSSSEANNFRPIAVLSVFGKLFESV